jgi:hypothetical protein
MRASLHLRGLVIAGVLATVALALAGVTFAMNHSGSPAVPLAAAALPATAAPAAVKAVAKTVPKAKPKVKPKPKPNRNLVAALAAGLPRSVAVGLAAHRVVVVSLTSAADHVAVMAGLEAHAGAQLAGASFVKVSVDRNGGDAAALTSALGALPVAPATLIYIRPATLVATMPGFNDRTIVQQAAIDAKSVTPQAVAAAAAAAAATTTATTPTGTPAPVAPVATGTD